MSLTSAQYNAIMRQYEERRIENKHILDDHTEEVYDLIPEYKEISDSISEMAIEMGKKRILGDKSALDGLAEIINEKIEKKAKLLEEFGFPVDYLDPIYSCKECKDTGYVNGKQCICLKQEVLSSLYSHSNIKDILERENFNTLTFDYYNDSDFDQMKAIINRCKDFVSNFDNEYRNLLFSGKPGVGKTFLSNCIAKDLIDSGHSVIYFTSFQMFDTLSKYTFNYDSPEDIIAMREDIFTCDLLIIDDLGTENNNSFVTSQLFLVVNERDIRRKSTIISTNHSLNEILDKYSERNLSRIIGSYDLVKPDIPDIRFKMRKQ